MDLAKKNEFFSPYNLDDSITTVFPDIFEHPFLFVYSDTTLIELAIYLGIGPQIYADGLLVFQQQQQEEQERREKISRGIRSRKVIGRLSSKHIIRHLLKSNFSSYSAQFRHRTTASEIMDPITEYRKINVDSPIRRVIDVFRETKFAFVPIMETKGSTNSYSNDDGKIPGYFKLKEYVEDEKIAGVLSIRDFLPLFSRSATNSISNTNAAIIKTSKMISITVKDISSDLISINKNASIKEAIDIMVNRQIRNIGIEDKDSKLIGLINDRTILEFLLRHMRATDSSGGIDADNNIQQTYYKGDITEGDSINSNKNATLNMSIINNLKIVPLSETRVVDDIITVSQASELLMSVHHPFLVLKSENAIVTPWDIVMKITEIFTNKQ